MIRKNLILKKLKFMNFRQLVLLRRFAKKLKCFNL